MDGDCLILSGMEFQTVGAAKLKALRPMAVVVKGTLDCVKGGKVDNLTGGM